MTKKRAVIIIEEGIIQNVYLDEDMDVLQIDLSNTEDLDPEELTLQRVKGKIPVPTFTGTVKPVINSEKVGEMFKSFWDNEVEKPVDQGELIGIIDKLIQETCSGDSGTSTWRRAARMALMLAKRAVRGESSDSLIDSHNGQVSLKGFDGRVNRK